MDSRNRRQQEDVISGKKWCGNDLKYGSGCNLGKKKTDVGDTSK